MFKKISALKILLFLPLIFLTNNSSANKNKSTDLQKFVKTILIKEFCLNNQLSDKIDPAKLPCDGLFGYFVTRNTKKEIIYAISPKTYFAIIAGADSYQEVQRELSNTDQNESLKIEFSGDNLSVKKENTNKKYNCKNFKRT